MLFSATLPCLQAVCTTPVLSRGDTVEGKWADRDGTGSQLDAWYPAIVVATNEDGTVRIRYDDGDTAAAAPPDKIRPRKRIRR